MYVHTPCKQPHGNASVINCMPCMNGSLLLFFGWLTYLYGKEVVRTYMQLGQWLQIFLAHFNFLFTIYDRKNKSSTKVPWTLNPLHSFYLWSMNLNSKLNLDNTSLGTSFRDCISLILIKRFLQFEIRSETAADNARGITCKNLYGLPKDEYTILSAPIRKCAEAAGYLIFCRSMCRRYSPIACPLLY